jgi:hypothetical protein
VCDKNVTAYKKIIDKESKKKLPNGIWEFSCGIMG